MWYLNVLCLSYPLPEYVICPCLSVLDPVAPGNLRIASSTSSSLTLTWDTPSPLNGPLGVYQLRYTIDQSDEPAATILFVDTFTIDSIQADRTYHFSVRAATMGQTGEALWGPYSNDIWVRNGMCTCLCYVFQSYGSI